MDESMLDPTALSAAGDTPFIVDARSPGEYAAGHIPRAVNIPVGELQARLGEVPVARPV